MEVPVYETKEKSMTVQEICSIFDNPDTDRISIVPPTKPKAGSIYLVTKTQDYLCDQYQWVNKGGQNVPRKDPIYFRRSYKCRRFAGDTVGDDKFQRFIYICNAKDMALIHYIGDESVHQDLPHGNAKYKRTMPSTLNQIRSECTTKESAHVYKESVVKQNVLPSQQGIANAKNMKQVQNMRFNVTKKQRLSHDALFNTLLLSYQMEDFVLEYSIYPELKLVFGNKEILQHLNRLLSTEHQPIMSYDTTFNLGDFFLSALVVKHPLFTGKTCFPAMFMIHDRKNQRSHDTFWRELTNAVPNLKNCSPQIVTDRESAFTNAIKHYIPGAKHLFCWNHIRTDVKFWVKKHGGKADDIAVYCSDIDKLLRTNTPEEFDSLYDKLSEKWSQAFLEYVEKTLKDSLKESCAQFVLQPLGLFDELSGITNNISESFNKVYKDLQQWKQVPIDSALLCFNHLQNFILLELLRGMCDVGDFQLRPEHRRRVLDAETVIFPRDTMKPADIVELVKNKELKTDNEHNDEQPIEVREESVPEERTSSQHAVAAKAVRDGKVYHCPQASSFVVIGTKGDKYAVSLFPDSCACPALGTCWHLIAVKMSIGNRNIDEKRVFNLTQLTRNQRKKPNKIAGRKRPRPCDIEDEELAVNPAPDSLVATPTSTPLVVGSLPSSTKKTTSSSKSRKRLKFDRLQKLETGLPSIEEEFTCRPAGRIPDIEEDQADGPIIITESDSDVSNNVCEHDSLWVDIDGIQLKKSHKEKIENGAELDSDIINAGMQIAKLQFPDIGSLQQSELVPVFNEKTKTWDYNARFNPAGGDLSAQIHHTGAKHWVLSFRDNDSLKLADSLFINKLSASLNIQLGQLYFPTMFLPTFKTKIANIA